MASTPLRLIAALLALAVFAPAQKPLPKSSPWLFVGFKKNSEDGVYYALSQDGYHWKLVNGEQPVFGPTEKGELMRDPFVQRAPDGSFRMMWTWSWYSPTVMGFSSSTDLVHWTPHRQLPVMTNEPAARNVWAPALYWEPDQKRWLIFWSTTIPGRFPGDGNGDNKLNHRIFSTTTKDFETFTPATVFFDPGYSVIDATLIQTGPKVTLIFKDERLNPLEKHLKTATGPTLEGPWTNISEPISEVWSEGAAIIPVQDGYLAFYDHYRPPQHYGAVFSKDLKTWTDAASRIGFPAGLRHGSFLQITQAEYDRLDHLKP